MSYIPQSDSQYILDASGTTINPSTDETVQLLRRMVKLLDSIATVDSQNRQRISLDSANTTASVTVAQATAANLNATVTQATAANLNANVGTVGSITNIAGLGGIDPRFQFMESARIAYATGVRPNLIFST
jgi:hypothetical protein